jgi:peptidoglycan/LPS O-acetylase OafA/YrhL
VFCLFVLINWAAQLDYSNLDHSSVYNINIEVARGVFCYLVVIGHSVLYISYVLQGDSYWPPIAEYQNINRLAATGVDGFFFLTGFLFFGKLKCGKINQGFLRKRALRIVPALVVYLVLSTLFLKFAFNREDIKEQVSIWLVPALTQMSQNRSPADINLAFFGHLWSLRDEFIFYIIIKIAAASPKKIKMLTGFLTTLIFAFLYNKIFVMFLFGGFAACLPRGKLNFNFDAYLIFALGVTLFAFGYIINSSGMEKVVHPALRYVTRLFTVIFLGLYFSLKLNPVKGANALASVGRTSYSAYLYSGMVLFISFKIAKTIQVSVINQYLIAMVVSVMHHSEFLRCRISVEILSGASCKTGVR